MWKYFIFMLNTQDALNEVEKIFPEKAKLKTKLEIFDI